MLSQQQRWKKMTDLSSSLWATQRAFNDWQSLSSRLEKSGLLQSVNLAKRVFPAFSANWLPDPRTIRGNPLLFDRFAAVFPKQISLAESIQTAMRTIEVPGQLRSLQSSIYNLNSTIGGRAFRLGDTSWLNTFEQVSVEAKAIVDSLAEQTTATKEDLHQLKQFVAASIESIRTEIKKGAKSPAAIIGLVLTIAGFLLGLYSAFPEAFKAPGDQAATMQDIANARDSIVKVFQTELNNWAKKRIIRVTCVVRERPFLRSQILQALREGYSVTVVNTKRKWANITYIDEQGWLVAGWVLKKYLTTYSVRQQLPKNARFVEWRKQRAK